MLKSTFSELVNDSAFGTLSLSHEKANWHITICIIFINILQQIYKHRYKELHLLPSLNSVILFKTVQLNILGPRPSDSNFQHMIYFAIISPNVIIHTEKKHAKAQLKKRKIISTLLTFSVFTECSVVFVVVLHIKQQKQIQHHLTLN